ncbi:hypothetical protein N836_27425 [Leptolyngbya sp. Heron Island J]|uniref:hypothetical protein n=1 Tax=Leptolyngbya sp. Heron Island J TaxID=1385935 RepID=UPI0003B985A2|nr:hypothetical protein [Leptolyngbya sp. Heron Island J]ESA32324.1 hypothetical protein N836_27425 [Leptolyngbya sp. Heron Island J]
MANSVPTWVMPSQSRGALVSPLDNSAKPIIRYIGIAILGSVGTGMITADILRRIYRRQRALSAVPAPFDASIVSDTTTRQEKPPLSKGLDEQLPAAMGVGSSMTLNGQSLLATKSAPGQTVVHFRGYTQNGNVDGLELTPIALDELMQLDTDAPSIDIPILRFLEQVEPAHLDTGDAMVFGVRYQNKYYCLWRSTSDLEQVMGWARRLTRQNRDVIVTQNTESQYSLWYVPPKQLR